MKKHLNNPFEDAFKKKAHEFLANPKAYTTEELWAIVNSINVHNLLNSRIVGAATAELRRRKLERSE